MASGKRTTRVGWKYPTKITPLELSLQSFLLHRLDEYGAVVKNAGKTASVINFNNDLIIEVPVVFKGNSGAFGVFPGCVTAVSAD